MAAMPVKRFNSARGAPRQPYSTDLRPHLRCPDSCMLEKIKLSPPRSRTASTISTYFLRLTGSVELDRRVTKISCGNASA